MATQKNRANQSQVMLLNDLKSAEHKIQTLLGPQVFDYLFLFPGTKPLKINIPTLSSEAEKVIQEYINLSLKLLSQVNVTVNLENKSLAKQFIDVAHEIYLTRYVQARILYPYYSLLRVFSPFERKILARNPKANPPEETFQVILTDEVVSNEYGGINIKATEKLEFTEHRISALLSTIPEIEERAYVMFEDLNDITTRGMVPVFNREDLMMLNQEVIEVCMIFVAKQVYEY